MREERQHARVVLPHSPRGVGGTPTARAVGADLPDDQLRQARFQLQPDGLGRSGHRLAQLRGGERSEHHVPVLERVGQFGIPEAPLVEVGAYAQDHDRRGRFVPSGG